MMSVKGGTQTWSTAPQKVDYKSDGAQNLSATDRAKALGDDSIGDVLNKVADPNYVDPTKKPRAVGNNELGKDAFMSLLLTQMKNQDPTNPLKSHEMAAQLAQFTSLEKLNNINEGINGLRKDQQPSHNFEALSFIGKTISTDNSKVSHMEKDAHHDVRFDLPGDAQTLSIQVKDAEGKVVRTIEYKNMKAGKNQVNWNGMTDDGSGAAPGEYTLSFNAVGSNGHKLFVETKTEGVISGVNFTPAGPQLLVGKQVINMADVKSISDSSAAPEPRPLGVPGAAIPAPMGAGAVAAGPPQMASQLPPQLQQQLQQMMQQQQMPQQQAPEAGEAAAPTSHMMPIGPNDSVHPKGPRKAEVKPETKANAAKLAKIGKGNNLNDAAMAQGLINKLNKTGAKAGMEG
jgi:flagellar basal-body rod modification protein FlgD